jgi:hypothetical protein
VLERESFEKPIFSATLVRPFQFSIVFFGFLIACESALVAEEPAIGFEPMTC